MIVMFKVFTSEIPNDEELGWMKGAVQDILEDMEVREVQVLSVERDPINKELTDPVPLSTDPTEFFCRLRHQLEEEGRPVAVNP